MGVSVSRGAALVLLIVMATMMWLPTPARALSCVSPDDLSLYRSAELVFVGELASLGEPTSERGAEIETRRGTMRVLTLVRGDYPWSTIEVVVNQEADDEVWGPVELPQLGERYVVATSADRPALTFGLCGRLDPESLEAKLSGRALSEDAPTHVAVGRYDYGNIAYLDSNGGVVGYAQASGASVQLWTRCGTSHVLVGVDNHHRLSWLDLATMERTPGRQLVERVELGARWVAVTCDDSDGRVVRALMNEPEADRTTLFEATATELDSVSVEGAQGLALLDDWALIRTTVDPQLRAFRASGDSSSIVVDGLSHAPTTAAASEGRVATVWRTSTTITSPPIATEVGIVEIRDGQPNIVARHLLDGRHDAGAWFGDLLSLRAVVPAPAPSIAMLDPLAGALQAATVEEKGWSAVGAGASFSGNRDMFLTTDFASPGRRLDLPGTTSLIVPIDADRVLPVAEAMQFGFRWQDMSDAPPRPEPTPTTNMASSTTRTGPPETSPGVAASPASEATDDSGVSNWLLPLIAGAGAGLVFTLVRQRRARGRVA